jgi:hypothetical protein
MNPLFFNGNQCTLSDGNLTVYKAGATYGSQLSTIGFPTTGKFYFETTIVSSSATNNQAMGIASSTATYVFALDCFYTGSLIRKFVDGSVTTGYGSASNGMVIGVAVDATNGKAYIAINNTWIDSSSPTGGTNGYSMTSGVQYFGWFQGYNSGASAYNFGQRPFAYTPPAGFLALNTFNLPISAVPNPATAMAVTTYTGTGATRSISNAVNTVSMQPDFVWIKRRDGANYHVLTDSVRGVLKEMYTNATTVEATPTTYGVNAFNSDGFSLLGAGSDYNVSASNYIAWQWKAGGAAVSNTAGTSTSTVSANQAAGFSIVTYTGSGSLSTRGHGLGAVPSMIIVKRRDVTDNWATYHSALGNTVAMFVNLTQAQYANAVYWNNTSPTSTVFTVNSATEVNASVASYVAYCWAPVAGYSAFGKYTGNASTDGPFIYTGFKPRFIMFKADMVASWQIHDSTREPSNESKKTLYPNSSEVEWPSVYGVDLLSNGFKIKQPTGYGLNNSGITYIYAAFAESAFNFATAR